MNRYETIISHSAFTSYLKEIEEIEKDRIYCRHGLTHLLDVARIAYIMNLEEGSPFSKDVIYGTALLHDIGKVKQYKEKIPHEKTGAAVAEGILMECGYVKEEIIKQYGTDYLSNPEYGKMISERQFDRVVSLIDQDKVVRGGHYNKDTLKIEPTVIDNVSLDDPIMQEEIFGPLMPILTYDDIDEVINIINDREKPLALYIFSNNKKVIKHVTSSTQYGGGCINDVVIHLATSYMGFGGVGESGMGSYHGKIGFDTFTHYKSTVDKKTWLDLPMRYHPFNNKFYNKLIRIFLK